MINVTLQVAPNSVHTEVREFTIGPNNSQLTLLGEINRVILVEASGKELERIIEQCGESIPYSNGRKSLRWYGDHAKFIVANVSFCD